MRLTNKKKSVLFLLTIILFVTFKAYASNISSQEWSNAIEKTLTNFVYDKEDANYFVRNQELYDGILEMVEFKCNKNLSKHIYTQNAGSPEEKKVTRYLSLENDAVYSYTLNPDFNENDPESKEYIKIKTNLPFIPGQTVSTFLLGPDNVFHGFEERIANYEPMFMDFMVAVKNNFEMVFFKEGKYIVKEENHDDMWADYVQRGRKLSSIEMSEIYFIINDGIVSECGFSGFDNGVEVKHIYNFQFDNITFDFPI